MAASPLLGRVTTVVVLVNAFLSVPVWLGPVERIALSWFGREAAHVAGSTEGQRLLAAVRVALLGGGALIASRVASFGAAVALMGAFSTALSSITLPAGFYLIVHRETLKPWQAAVCCAFVVLGLVAMLVGLSAHLGVEGMVIFLITITCFAWSVVGLQRCGAAVRQAFRDEAVLKARGDTPQMPEEQLRGRSDSSDGSGYVPAHLLTAAPASPTPLYRNDSVDIGQAEDLALQAAIARMEAPSRSSA